MRKECALHIGQWADGWVANDDNLTQLKSWNEANGPIILVLGENDWKALGILSDDTIPLVSNALKCRRDRAAHGGNGALLEEPHALLSACRGSGVENWLGMNRCARYNARR